MSRLRLLFLIAGTHSALWLSGCGGGFEGGVETVPVEGQLFVDDQPYGPVSLLLVPQQPTDESPTTSAVVEEDGHFVLSTYGDGDGAPPGSYTVALTPVDMTQLDARVPAVEKGTVEVPESGGEIEIRLKSTGQRQGSLLPPPR